MHACECIHILPPWLCQTAWYSAVDGPSVRVKDQYITCILEQPNRRNDLAKAHSAASTFAVSDNETSTNRQTTIVITSDCLQNCTRPETRFEPTKTFTGEGTMCVCVWASWTYLVSCVHRYGLSRPASSYPFTCQSSDVTGADLLG